MTATRPARMPKPRLAAAPYRLDLTIGRTTYAIEPLTCDPIIAERGFRLLKGDGTAYDVARTPHGPQCDCPDFVFRRDGIDPEGCKHIRALVGSGLIPS